MLTLKETSVVITSHPEDWNQTCWISLCRLVESWLEWVLLSQEYKLVYIIVKILREATSSIIQITQISIL